ncbi:MAG: 2,3-bisphosphoglycerate-independent phosphoglycerate mutase [Chloroflexi bacterium]|nr:2,3-bisphosphoglycerate-independent phosphoglycerate mutase [Chloroflexota bacterium]MCI0818589.1 2,3-bisphosphoglycerate-independent phosphoglycerate mutase [Chloroflexota bacterium]MCI0832584.1 2,3-bisphosphoglycerate-independent phosphoglycerate mutase [Chloroflexota bacterium]MCI0842880.1 2,3-bisphosphoglycerate-independent phosphoglycerate mutase [Chloroflexota bacterium]
MDLALAQELSQEAETKIVLFVMDGLGGLPHPDTRRTELEAAYTPHLDRLAKESVCGLTVPVAPGVTPGSGPGHLALFGYDPLVYNVGRGVLEAAGIDFDLQPSDVAARGNFCTIDDDGVITDRRAGRIGSERSEELVAGLREISLGDSVRALVEPVREHRFVLVLRGEGLSDEVTDTDPQKVGVKALASRGSRKDGKATAKLVNEWVSGAQTYLADKSPANMALLRGFAKRPDWPQMADVFKMRAAAVAHYPMYRGLAKLVGMEALTVGPALEDSFAVLRENWDRFDYFFVHYKHTDAAGEDGDYERKVEKIEEVDGAIRTLVEMEPDVLMVTGDHSTPATMAAHSWHSVPFMLHSKWARADRCDNFNEPALAHGSLGTFPAKESLPLAMAHAGRLRKYGA